MIERAAIALAWVSLSLLWAHWPITGAARALPGSPWRPCCRRSSPWRGSPSWATTARPARHVEARCMRAPPPAVTAAATSACPDDVRPRPHPERMPLRLLRKKTQGIELSRVSTLMLLFRAAPPSLWSGASRRLPEIPECPEPSRAAGQRFSRHINPLKAAPRPLEGPAKALPPQPSRALPWHLPCPVCAIQVSAPTARSAPPGHPITSRSPCPISRTPRRPHLPPEMRRPCVKQQPEPPRAGQHHGRVFGVSPPTRCRYW